MTLPRLPQRLLPKGCGDQMCVSIGLAMMDYSPTTEGVLSYAVFSRRVNAWKRIEEDSAPRTVAGATNAPNV